MNNSNRRHTVMINSRFQITLILKFIALNTAIMLVFGFLMYLFLDSEIQGNFRSAQVTYKNVKAMLFPIVVTLSLLNLVFSSILTAVYVLMASFRIAGPMYRFNQALREMASGRLRPYTSIREKDQFNECSSNLGALACRLSETFDSLHRLSEEIESLPGVSEHREIVAKLSELKAELDKYRST